MAPFCGSRDKACQRQGTLSPCQTVWYPIWKLDEEDREFVDDEEAVSEAEEAMGDDFDSDEHNAEDPVSLVE